MRIITWLFTRHNPFKHLLHKTNLFSSALCIHCQDQQEEDTAHFLGKCAAFTEFRQTILGSPTLGMAEIANEKITDILKYVRTTGRFEGDIFKDPHLQNQD